MDRRDFLKAFAIFPFVSAPEPVQSQPAIIQAWDNRAGVKGYIVTWPTPLLDANYVIVAQPISATRADLTTVDLRVAAQAKGMKS